MSLKKAKLLVTPGSTPAVIAALAAGPIIWLGALQLTFALVPFACWFRWDFALHAVSAVALVMTLSAGLLSWLSWRAAGEQQEEDPSPAARNRFLSAMGIAVSGFSALSIAGQELGNWMLNPCY